MTKPYSDMLKLAKIKELPKAFHNDLHVHDKAALEQYGNDKPFIWVIRECGTHFYALSRAHDDDVMNYLYMFRQHFIQERYFALWDGERWAWPATDDLERFTKDVQDWLRKNGIGNPKPVKYHY